MPALIQVMQNDEGESEDVRIAAARTLGEVGSEAAIPDLIEILCGASARHEEVYDDVRESVAEALGSIRSTEAVTALIQALWSEYAGYYAAEALGAIGSAVVEKAVDLLVCRRQKRRGQTGVELKLIIFPVDPSFKLSYNGNINS